MTSRSDDLRSLGLPLAVYTVFAMVVAGPDLPHLAGRFLGHPQSDMWKHLWGMWWFEKCLVERKTLPLFCFDLNFPDGGYLYFADPLNALFALPLRVLLPAPLVYNLVVLGHLVLGALGAYLLARQVAGTRSGALVAGAAFGFCPVVLAYSVGSGVTETLHLAWLPLHLAALLRMLDDPEDPASLVAAAAFLALAALGTWYYAVFLALLDSVVVAAWAWANRPPLLRRARIRRAWGAAARRLFLMGLLAVLMVLPYVSAFRMVMDSPYNLVAPRGSRERSQGSYQTYLGRSGWWSLDVQGRRGHFNEATLLGLVEPGKDRAVVTVSIDRLTRVHYLGLLLLALAALGAWAAPRSGPWEAPRRGPRPVPPWTWGAAFLLCVALSLGPLIHASFREGSPAVPNPLYLLLYLLFPFFDQLAHPFRMLVPATLAASVLAAQGTRWLESRLPARLRLPLGLLLSVALLAEVLVVSPVPYPLPSAPDQAPPFYEEIARDGATYGVLDLPVERPGTILIPGEYFYYQSLHGKRIPYRTSGVLSDSITRTRFIMGWTDLADRLAPGPLGRRIKTGREDIPPVTPLTDGVPQLAGMGVQYVVVHLDAFTPPQARAVLQTLQAAMGKPAMLAPPLAVYRVPGARPRDEFRPAPRTGQP